MAVTYNILILRLIKLFYRATPFLSIGWQDGEFGCRCAPDRPGRPPGFRPEYTQSIAGRCVLS